MFLLDLFVSKLICSALEKKGRDAITFDSRFCLFSLDLITSILFVLLCIFVVILISRLYPIYCSNVDLEDPNTLKEEKSILDACIPIPPLPGKIDDRKEK